MIRNNLTGMPLPRLLPCWTRPRGHLLFKASS
nr:MAG TPA: hypothetical protein [Bacteriophage sp.]